MLLRASGFMKEIRTNSVSIRKLIEYHYTLFITIVVYAFMQQIPMLTLNVMIAVGSRDSSFVDLFVDAIVFWVTWVLNSSGTGDRLLHNCRYANC